MVVTFVNGMGTAAPRIAESVHSRHRATPPPNCENGFPQDRMATLPQIRKCIVPRAGARQRSSILRTLQKSNTIPHDGMFLRRCESNEVTDATGFGCAVREWNTAPAMNPGRRNVRTPTTSPDTQLTAISSDLPTHQGSRVHSIRRFRQSRSCAQWKPETLLARGPGHLHWRNPAIENAAKRE